MTKPRILEAVREGAGEGAAQLISHLKKPDMAREAERLLADTGWLPEPLRLAADAPAPERVGNDESVDLPAFLVGNADGVAPEEGTGEIENECRGAGESDPQPVAAE